MMCFAVLLLCAVSGHTMGSTLKPLQEMNMEDALLSLIKQMSNVEEKILVLEKKEWVEEMRKMKDELSMEIKEELLLEIKSSEQRFEENKKEIESKLEQVLARMSEIEKSSNVAVDDVWNRLQVEKNKLLLMNNHLLAEVLELRKRDLDTFEKIANVESEVRDRVTLAESVEQGKKIQEELLVEIKRVERNYLEDKNEQSSKFEQVLHKISELEKSSNAAIDNVSNRLQVGENKVLLMNNNLSAEVHELQKRDLDTFEKIANVESEVSRDRVRAELLQVRLNETANMTHSCLAAQTQIQESMQKNVERLDVIEESNISARIGNVENSFKTLRQDLDNISNRQDDTLKLIVQNNTNDIGEVKQELSRIQTICSPPCENGGQCVKNVCNCTPLFTGDTAKCGVDFDNEGSNGGGNISSVLVWPWMAAVYKIYSSEYTCDGSVIHRHFVLTSAWCGDFHAKAGLSVKLGLSDLKKGTHLQVYRIQSVHMHPEFIRSKSKNFDYNIALLELEEPIPFGPFVRPVCLPSPEIPQDELFYNPQSTVKAVRLSEYISSPQTASPTLLNLTIYSQEECRRKLQGLSLERIYPSPELSFCAGSPSTTCSTDSSPVLQSGLAGDGARTWTQVGINSGCSRKFVRSPRLDHLKVWVDATIEASSKR